MAGGLAIGGLDRSLCQSNTAVDEACRTAALAAATAPFALLARQIAAPAVVLGAGHLGVDEAIDALVGDHLAPVFAGQAAGDLFWRPAACEPFHHRTAQAGLPFEATARPAPCSCLLIGIGRLVANLNTLVALQLPRDR